MTLGLLMHDAAGADSLMKTKQLSRVVQTYL